MRITLIDRHNHHVFQPLLYQVATAGLSPGDIAAPIRWVLRHQKNVRVLLAEATAVDLAARRVDLDRGQSLTYDYLIIAAGAGSSYFGHDDWAPYAPSLKTLDDALRIRARMLAAYEEAERTQDPAERERLLTFVLVGGGATGVEMAGAIAEIARQTLADEFRMIHTAEARVILVEAGPTILGAFPERLRSAARASLARLGVRVRERTAVTRIEPGKVWLGDDVIEAGTILWTAGVTASSLGATLGVPLDRAGRVLVEPDLSCRAIPKLSSSATWRDWLDPTGKQYPGVSQVAMQQAAHAARMVAAS